MSDLSVTMRDPAFFQVHTLVDNIFYKYKDTLEPYKLFNGEWPLVWKGVRITSLQTTTDSRLSNQIYTFFTQTHFPLEQGIDLSIHNGEVNAKICAVHLDHTPFVFQIVVENENSAREGTMRLFMAPRRNLFGQRFSMNETRRLMFQLDAFPVSCKLLDYLNFTKTYIEY